MQVRDVTANVTEAEERIVISLEEGEEPPPATRHSSPSASAKGPKRNSGEGARAVRLRQRSRALLCPSRGSRGYGHTSPSNFTLTVLSLTGNLRVLIAKHCFCLIIVTVIGISNSPRAAVSHKIYFEEIVDLPPSLKAHGQDSCLID